MLDKKGIFILIAGANASGKSSVIKPKYVKGRIGLYANPDMLNDPDFPIAEKDILSDMGYKTLISKKADQFAIVCVDDWFQSARCRSEGIGTESNLVSGRDFRNFRKAKIFEMKTELYFVGVPLETAKGREEKRAANKEQAKIDHAEIERRYVKGLSNLQKHIDSGNIDLIKFYDNTLGKGEEELVFHMENGKTKFLNPEPILQWFKDARFLNPYIKLPAFLEE